MLLYRKVFATAEEAEKCSLPKANQLIRRASKQANKSEDYDPYEDCFATPQWLFSALDAEFGFGLDAAATEECHKCDVYLTPEQDALTQNWITASGGKPIFLNAPFERTELPKFVEKAYSESQKGAEVVCVLPFYKSYPWFRDFVWTYAEVRQIQGMVVFDGFGRKKGKHAGNIAGSQSFDTIVAIFRPGQKGFSGPYIDRPGKNTPSSSSHCLMDSFQEPCPAAEYPLKNHKSKRTLVTSGPRATSDERYTPQYALDILLPYLPKDEIIWEAAYGTGELAKHLRAAGHEVVGDARMNFLHRTPSEFGIIVTNPPYSFKDEFLERAYSLGKPFAFLLPLDALTGGKRCPLYIRHGIQVLVPRKRINFIDNGQPANHSNLSTGWFCWGLLPRDLLFVKATW